MASRPNALRPPAILLTATAIGLAVLDGCTIDTGTTTQHRSSIDSVQPVPVEYQFPFQTSDPQTVLRFTHQGAEVIDAFKTPQFKVTKEKATATYSTHLGPFVIKHTEVQDNNSVVPLGMEKDLAPADPVFHLAGCATDQKTATTITFRFEEKSYSIPGLELPVNCHQKPGAEVLSDVEILDMPYPLQAK